MSVPKAAKKQPRTKGGSRKSSRAFTTNTPQKPAVGLPVAQEIFGTADAITQQKRMRFNPLRMLSPETLSMAMDAFEYGDLRTAALLWQAMAGRDDTILSVKPKREMDTAQRGIQVLALDDSPAAQEQKARLEYCYNNLTATSAYDRNIRGGASRLLLQMMEAESYFYSNHHLAWVPSTDGLTVICEHTPLQFFENRTGKLRFIEDGVSIEGVEMKDREWMTTCGTGLMMACGILYQIKRLSMTDLVAYSEKFGMPGVLGRTNAAKGTDAGNAMRDAVAAFGNEFAAVVYGDEGSGKIELITPQGGATNIPMPIIIERCDRKIAALYRGSDLSSMSSVKGEGTGASLQGEETDILAQADAMILTEALNHYIDRVVLEYHFGPGVKRLAYAQIVVPEKEDLEFLLKAILALVNLGAPIAISDALERLGFAMPDDGEPLLTPAVPAAPEELPGDTKITAANARQVARQISQLPAVSTFFTKSRVLLGTAFAGVMQAISPAFTAAINGEDAMFTARLQAIAASLPQVLADKGVIGDAAAAFQKIFATAFFNGATQPQP